MPNPVLFPLALASVLVAAGPAFAAPNDALPKPVLRCRVTYADVTQEVTAAISNDPYVIDAVDIGGRFRFKAVMIGHGRQIDYIKLYAYLNTRRQPVPIQQATYLPPFPAGAGPIPLTGQQRLYAGVLERELSYDCTLEETQ